MFNGKSTHIPPRMSIEKRFVGGVSSFFHASREEISLELNFLCGEDLIDKSTDCVINWNLVMFS